MKYLLTYEDALELVKTYKDFNFSKTEYVLNGYKVVTFTYFLCDFNHFENPLKEKPEVKGYDMRGTTFVFNIDGSLYKRFFMLSKFFNLDQVPSTQYNVVKNKKIVGAAEKADGSCIAFMNLPDGTVFPKTIGSFCNEQTEAAMKIYKSDEYLQCFVKKYLGVDENLGQSDRVFNYTPIFEYVSFSNRIVLKYSNPELIFLGARNNDTGGFIPSYENFQFKKIKTTKFIENVNLDELIEKSKSEKDKEGWVIGFDDGSFIKLKTTWYFDLHGIRTMNIFREDYVIRNYLEENLDDIVGQLDPEGDKDAFKFIDQVKLAVDNQIKDIDDKIKQFIKIYKNVFNLDWCDFAKFACKLPYFGLAVTVIQKPELYNKKKIEFIINKTKHLKKAQQFVDKWAKLEYENTCIK